MLWWSIDQEAEETVESNIWIREPRRFPRVGDELLRLRSPQLRPFFLNEFRHVDEQRQVPIEVPVKAGQTIVTSPVRTMTRSRHPMVAIVLPGSSETASTPSEPR